ncbi:MAG: arylsulfatase A-like enzyme, partial [Saprospiraceae bacterium]
MHSNCQIIKFKFLLLVGVLILSSCGKKKVVVEQTKPNVIIVITDDQGYADLGAHGNPIIHTPHLDQFYMESAHFTDFHVSPTCAPTRASLLTGRYANSTGVWHTIGGWSLLRQNEKTMAEMFVEAGYRTGGFGKWHLGDNYPFRPEHRGFQETVMHGGGGVQQTPDYWDNDYFDDTYFHNGKPQQYQGYCTDVFFDEAIKFIKEKNDTPFFCYIATNAPHGPYNVPLENYKLYKDVSDIILTDTQKRFYGMISNIDTNFGNLREALIEAKVADNTILIFMSDNGTAQGYRSKKDGAKGFNAGMRGTKGSEYEGGHRVPFFVHWKNGKIDVSQDIATLTAHVDVLPTLAELCGIELPQDHLDLVGRSLVSELKGVKRDDNRMLITDSQRLQEPVKWRKSSVMQNKWRLVNGIELYNLENDRGQENDIATSHPTKVDDMRTFYEDWWETVSLEFDKEIHFQLGNPLENPITLTAHDVHAPNGQHPWNQIYIRKGSEGSGYWSINIIEEGDYNISLRRYPIESDLTINTSIPGVSKEELPGLEYDIPSGKGMQYVKAELQIGALVKEETPINANDLSADFNVYLGLGK